MSECEFDLGFLKKLKKRSAFLETLGFIFLDSLCLGSSLSWF